MPERKKGGRPEEGLRVEAPAAKMRAGEWDYLKELPKLNRHWYRRCLDDLGRSLQETGASPTVAELERLCDRVVTTFLRSITSQAPDSEAPQFPADRVYFIPFEGDRAGRFNFAKPYYQVLEVPQALSKMGGKGHETESLSGSLWSCLPWLEGNVRIDPARSMSERTEETLTFQELLSRAPEETALGARQGMVRHLRLRKSLLLRGDDEDIASGQTLLRVCRQQARKGQRSSRGKRGKSPAKPAAASPEEDLRKLLLVALAKVFEAYRLAPGKAEIEEILGNQVDLLRWLADLSGLPGELKSRSETPGRTGDGPAGRDILWLSSEKKDFDAVRRLLLRGYFLGSESIGAVGKEVSELLDGWAGIRESEEAGDQGDTEQETKERPTTAAVAEALFERRDKLASAPFFLALRWRREGLERKGGEQSSGPGAAGRKGSGDGKPDGEKAQDGAGEALRAEIEGFLDELGKHLESFADYFLRSQRELDLEPRIRTSDRDDGRRAGSAQASFVWVCPDFEDLTASLPLGRTAGLGDREIRAIEAGREDITRPYRLFFRRLEAEVLDRHSSAISNYWRMQGQAAREERLFGSFEDARTKLKQPPAIFSHELPKDPSPQNMFLRVRICDSLNEPVIDGLFVLSTDYDEATVWRKFGAARPGVQAEGDEEGLGEVEDVRSDDVQDLLAFAKVFFFIVRDYLHGLDRAREAADIGLLNQFLYDKRLTHLERRLKVDLTGGEKASVALTDAERWQPIVDKVLNHYAYSLLDKPEDVRNETFPYDRLLLIPLAEEGGLSVGEEAGRDPVGLVPVPFYLFQAIFVDCEQGEIQGSHYSLVKPFQSPIERLSLFNERFRSRSFQKVYEVDGEQVRLTSSLEKHYVGAIKTEDGQDDSWVVKLGAEDTRGIHWARRALTGFWQERVAGPTGRPRTGKDGQLTSEDARTFVQFLSRLTQDLEDIDRRRPTDLRGAVLRFLLRFSLLQALVRCLERSAEGSTELGRDRALEFLENHYRERDLKLKFDEAEDLDVLRLARRADLGTAQDDESGGIDIVERLRTGGRSRREMDDPLPDPFSELDFLSLQLGTDEPFLLALLRYFSDRIRKASDGSEKTENDADSNGPPTTWYQPLLTRPVSASRDVKGTTAERIEKVVRPLDSLYDAIGAGEDALSVFLGTVSLEVGQGQRSPKRLRCLVAMIRDFDDSRGNLYQSAKDLGERLEGDRKDLTLFTRTFFKSAERNLKVAREQQQVRVLTEEIQDIARSWYSQGMDTVGRDLRAVLDRFFQGATVPRLDRLQPETMERLFQTAVEILCQEQTTREDQPIELESFPFDRILHVPILFGADAAACLSYARAAQEGSEEDDESPYERIRRLGRHKLLSGGKKRPVKDQPRHLHLAALRTAPELAAEVRSLRHVLETVADPRYADGFRRRLYQADPLQTLVIAGTLHHLLRLLPAAQNPGRDGSEPKLGGRLADLRSLVEDALAKNIESVEQRASSWREESLVRTAVFMDQAVVLDPVEPEQEGRERTLQSRLEDPGRVPVLADLFRAVEGGEDWAYGLGREGNRSKVFYVFYSFPPPKGFMEQFEAGARASYHGVFCLVLDDVATDEKLGDRVAEAADRADIDTFFHNVIDRLRLVLELQIWRYRLSLSRTDQTATGLLHRLKNELNEPAKAFAFLDTALHSDNGLAEQKTALLDRIRRAQESIGEVRKTFEQLKGFSDKQRGDVPRQTFSSSFVGWKLVESLCSAAVAAAKETDRADGRPHPGKETLQKIESIKEEAETAKKRELQGPSGGYRTDPGVDLQRIQRALHRLGEALQSFVSTGGQEVEIILSFVVYSDKTLRMRGSYRLEEALNILVENAFQAAWGRLERQLEDQEVPDPVQVRMVCRSSGGGEVLLEIINSGKPLDDEFATTLNDDVARPIGGRRYSRSGAKKLGGSGFGHYFARQIVAETCGGREAGKQLDVKIANLPEDDGGSPFPLVRVRANLLEARPATPRKVSVQRLLDAVVRVVDKPLEELAKGSGELVEDRSRECWLPDDVDPGELFQAMLSVMEVDRQSKEEALHTFLKNNLLAKLRLGPGELVDDLRESASHLLEHAGAKSKGRARLEQLVRELETVLGTTASFEELRVWLEDWRTRDARLIRRVVANGSKAGVPMLGKQLDRWLAEGEFSLLDLLSPSERERASERWQSFQPFVGTERGVDLLFEILDQHGDEVDRSKDAVPECVRELFKQEDWALTCCTSDGQLELSLELADAEGVGQLEPSEVPSVCDTLPQAQLGSAFSQYQQSIAGANRHGTEVGNGGAAGLSLWRRLDPSREAGACQVMSRVGTVRLSMTGSGVDSPLPA